MGHFLGEIRQFLKTQFRMRELTLPEHARDTDLISFIQEAQSVLYQET